MSSLKSALVISESDIPEALLVPKERLQNGSVGAKVVYGSECSVMIASRQAGYHSTPHMHDCEQLNYVLAGTIWIFVDEGGFRATKGDFFRVPRGAIHWSWIEPDGECLLLEVHTPPLIGDAGVSVAACSLIDEGEEAAPLAVPTDFVSIPNGADIERAVMGDETYIRMSRSNPFHG